MNGGLLNHQFARADDESSEGTVDEDDAPGYSMVNADDGTDNRGHTSNAAGKRGAGADEDSEGTASDATVSDTEGPAGKAGLGTPRSKRVQAAGGESDATISDSDVTQTDNEEKGDDDSGTESEPEEERGRKSVGTPGTSNNKA
eukprot:7733981-Pyramimonas_sp.AAC.1